MLKFRFSEEILSFRSYKNEAFAIVEGLTKDDLIIKVLILEEHLKESFISLNKYFAKIRRESYKSRSRI